MPTSTVSSSHQNSGVTAGYIGHVSQTSLPNLVRGPQLESLKQLFTEGALIKRSFTPAMTDQDIDHQITLAEQWLNKTSNYLRKNVSQYAEERFLFRTPQPSYGWNLPGSHANGYADQWGNVQQNMALFLGNLDQLMRDPSIYPDAR